jgi:hypothetical protein
MALLKSRRGVASKAQKQIRLEILPVGARWWMARSARAAMMALHLSGVVFRRKWKPPQQKPWEGPFADPTQRLPQHPMVAAQKREEKRRYRLRKEICEREAARPAAERDDGVGDDIAARPFSRIPNHPVRPMAAAEALLCWRALARNSKRLARKNDTSAGLLLK